ncbi:tetratricopeptide repeat protein [Myroides sp. WP-1]|uniref:SEL1-like repeat protein n=1 Tax=Myroides sp. WP-1 TaxID=2759944 RepID=UPI0015FE4813|nr:tetratricopeptide repeat protein [Myroides sp. WP-1]MBB1138252.1 sel1 repeat family protein [Myroides sp. WP-1]
MGEFNVRYLSYISEFANGQESLSEAAQAYFEGNDYADPIRWFKAHALCMLALQTGKEGEVFQQLYEQINEESNRERSSFYLNDKDYALWFDDVVLLNQLFIDKGYAKAYTFMHELYMNARYGFKDDEKATAFLKQGYDAGDPTAKAFVGYNLYYGSQGYEQDQEKGMEFIRSSYAPGNRVAPLFALNIEFRACESAEEGKAVLDKYHELIHVEKRGLYVLADYYLREGEDEKAAETFLEGIKNNSGYCNYMMGLMICNTRFAPLGYEIAQGVPYLQMGFEHGIAYAGFVQGYYYLYPADQSEPQFEKAIQTLEKAALYCSNEALLELAILYLYHNEYKNIEKALVYLDRAIAGKSTRAMNEKAVALLEHQEIEQNPAEAHALLLEAMELGDDYAPYRLGYGYQFGEFGTEEEYNKCIEFYELAAERNNGLGIEYAGRYHRYNENPDLDKAVAFYEKGLELYNSNYCKVELAMMLERGYGLEADPVKAEQYYLEALENNYPFAAVRVGYLYEDGLLGEVDAEKARTYFEMAANADLAEGIYQFARCNRYGIGGEENRALAFELFEKALEYGYNDANVDLALAHEEGAGGIEENPEKAVEYMTAAAEIGFGYAQYKLGTYYLYAYGIEKDLDLAKYWLEKAKDNGSALAMLTLGDFYLYGYEEDQPYDLAFPYYEEAEQQGYVSEGLGICYQFAIGVERDDKKAFHYYKIAVERGYDAAYFRLGMCYYYAIGTEKDYVEAMYYLRAVADRGHLEASSYVGIMLVKGEGVAQEAVEGVSYLEKAANNGFDMAQYELGNCYLKGEGVEQNDEIALHWYQQAAENGNEDAQKIVGGPRKRRR